MKWRRARSPNGTSAIWTPGGYQRETIGKFGRCRWGAAPIAVSRFVDRARWSISCLVTSTITSSQAATLASCSVPSPSCSVRLRVNCANRYSHISPCSSSQAWASNHTSSSRLSTRSGGSTAIEASLLVRVEADAIPLRWGSGWNPWPPLSAGLVVGHDGVGANREGADADDRRRGGMEAEAVRRQLVEPAQVLHDRDAGRQQGRVHRTRR